MTIPIQVICSVSGPVLFKGYLNNAERTESVLIKVPELTGDEQRLYRTGDLAKYNHESDLVVIGRKDFQFKIQNQRIEAAEVEHTVMNSMPSIISNCVVMKAVHEEQDYLVAYLAVGDQEKAIDVNVIRQYCQQRLASFSVPSLFVILPKLPVLPTGKIDRSQVRKLISTK